VLSRVDFDLEAHLDDRLKGRLEPIVEGEAALALLPARLPQPGVKGLADSVDQTADGTGLPLHEVDIIGVARRWIEVQLVHRRAATKHRLFGHRWPPKHFDERAATVATLLQYPASCGNLARSKAVVSGLATVMEPVSVWTWTVAARST